MISQYFQKQIMMRRVIYSLIPVYLFSTYLYGWRVVALTVLVFSLGILTEYLIEKSRKKKISEAVAVTCMLYTLSLPPMVPFWIAGIGIVFAILVAKGIYGGFGRNIFNPAIAGRLFVYITFPTTMTTAWMSPGNFGLIDTATSATPLALLRNGESLSLFDLFFGFRNGSIGEGSILLIILGGIYLIYTKTANWRLILSTFGSALVLSFAFHLVGLDKALPPVESMLSGSMIFVAVYFATDPVSAPKKPISQWIYGVIIGTVSILVRTFSLFPEGTSFGIIMGNTFASLLDEMAAKKKTEKKE
jgi:Na+-transporting NADH:ubiquinone oxidoreductase subunit B